MILSPSSLRVLNTTFRRDYQRGYDDAKTWYQEVTTTIPSSSSQNDYGWVAKISGMREWLGERTISNLIGQSYTLKNRTWEKTIGVDRDDIQDDNLGMYNAAIFPELGRAVRQHPDQLFRDLLVAGHTSAVPCYDGQPFFSATHPVNSKDTSLGTQSNYFTSTALTQDNFAAVRSNMRKFKGEDNQAMGGAPTVLAVPPALETTALKIVQAQTIFTTTATTNAAAPSNITYGMAQVLVIDSLPDDTTWYAFNTSRAIRPLIFQLREAPNFVQKTATTDDNVFHHREYLYGVDGRWNAGVSLWQLAAKCAA